MDVDHGAGWGSGDLRHLHVNYTHLQKPGGHGEGYLVTVLESDAAEGEGNNAQQEDKVTAP